MKKIIIVLAVSAVALASATAYAQMNHRLSQAQTGEGMMHGPMQKHMQDKMQGKMHEKHSAQPTGHAGHGTEHASAGPQGDRGPSSLAFHGINQKMHEAMNVTFTGNADVDFVKGMIPHHRGAVDMAKVVLAFGSDPEIRKLAEAVIRTQEAEIATMHAWLERNVR
jgi:hypothetical protein